MRVYSPTDTLDYVRCPRYWAFRRSGWRPAHIEDGDIYKAIGTGIHRMAEMRHRIAIADPHYEICNTDILAMTSLGIEAGLREIRLAISEGAKPLPRLGDWEPRATEGIKRGGLAYIGAFSGLFPQTWTLIHAEKVFGSGKRGDNEYEGTTDLILTDDYGLAIVDLKSKKAFKSNYYREQFVSQFQLSWQMYQYSWLAQKHFNELPKHFYMIMVELQPIPAVTLHPYRLCENFLAYWKHTVFPLWEQMERIEAGLGVPGIAPEHIAYGRLCPFYDACFTHMRDEGLMRQQYLKIGEDKPVADQIQS